MEYQAKISRLLADAKRRREESDLLIHGEPSFFDLIRLGLLRQRVYILWAAALSLVHILEIWVLVRFHYAFPPSSGLSALRIISSISVCGLLGAISFRLADFDSEVGLGADSASSFRIRRASEAARGILAAGASIAVLLALWVALFSNLQLNSPTAFRAVVFSGIIALPADITAAFLLYISGRVGALPVPRRIRIFSLVSILIGLILLAMDLTLGYLLLTLLPRFYLLSAAWRNLSGERLISLLRGQRIVEEDREFFKNFRRSFASFAAGQLLNDLGFLFLYAALSRFETGIALLLYLAHKSAHLAVVLAGKTQASYTTELKAAILIGESKRASQIMGRLFLLGLVFSLIGYSLSPLFLMQRRALHWLSPLGEALSFDWTLILLGLVLSTALVIQVTAARLAAQASAKAAAAQGLIFLAFALAAWRICPDFVHYYSFRSALYILAFAQIAFACLSLAAAWKIVLASGLEPVDSPSGACSLSEIIALGAADPAATKVFMFEFERGLGSSWTARTASLRPLLKGEDRYCFWGPTLFVAAKREDERDFVDFRRGLIIAFAGHFRSFSEASAARGPKALFGELLRTPDFASVLYSLAAGRERATLAPEDAEECKQVILDLKLGAEARGRVQSFALAPGFDISRVGSIEGVVCLRRFLRALHRSGEFLLPDVGNRREFGGFLHLNRAGRPGWVLILPSELRERFAALRFAVFSVNLSEALGGAGGGA